MTAAMLLNCVLPACQILKVGESIFDLLETVAVSSTFDVLYMLIPIATTDNWKTKIK